MPADAPRLTRNGDAPAHGIVHLGLGAFFRAFGAVYIDELMKAQGGDWGITGVSLKSPGTRDRLAQQGGVFTSVALGPDGRHRRVIGSVIDVRVAPEDPEAVLALMADKRTRLVTLTVTEKGYCHNPATGGIDPDHPDIRHDIETSLPKSAPGFIVRALARRREAGHAPFTVLSCDNLPDNGKLVRGVVTELARAIDPALAKWIIDEGRFPSTMVDRIVPATTADDIAKLTAETGVEDAAPVLHEPFRQWVIEDNFVDGTRPALEMVGVEMVRDVTPFEHMKLRMLNGTHSALAYLGYLAGHETIAETVADPVFSSFVKHLWAHEIIPALTPPQDTDLEDYAETLLARYENPAIRHRTWQIAMDGSQKLPQRILSTMAENHAAGRLSPGLTLAVAAWMRYVGGTDDTGAAIEVKDPLANRLRALSDDAGWPAAKVDALLGVHEIFAPGFAEAHRNDLVAAYASLVENGARGATEKVMTG
ncbi:mannitol dehydrogenase family protein [Sulfitobacter sp. D35]|uniref:mannitol dehydrogenase family protein n=1 Tax=Sulfitobacter sp. D35 TaxID=3083252 RepID=UPI00296F8019|nr:mannitol dehydrogenase family protein [Sulfitobacter sp. D35]MDW4499675.1 mannitol dehydrogenase family protein [Sulfitobacter sp. D35]